MRPSPEGAPSPAGSSGARGCWGSLAPVLGILVLGLFAYGNSLHGEFVFDDTNQVRDNLAIRDLGTFAGPSGYRAFPNRFVGYLTFALNYRLGGLEVSGYHLANLVIHLIASLLVYALVVLAFRTPSVRNSGVAPSARAVAFLAGALFVTHPLGTQAVSYVVQRFASLATMFYLLATVLYLAWRLSAPPARVGRFGRVTMYLGSLASALLAVHTKEIAFTLPVALALEEWLLFPPGGARRWLPLLPMGLVSLLIPASGIDLRGPLASIAASAGNATRVQTEMSRIDYATTQIVVVARYLRLLVWPSGQNLDYDFPIYGSLLHPRVLGSALLLGALGAFAAWAGRRTIARTGCVTLDPAFRLVALGIGWFFVALGVESSFIPIADVIYEHRAYLPSVGLLVAAATLLGLAFHRLSPASGVRATTLSGVALALVLGSITLQRNTVWTNALTLWGDTVAKSPGKARPHLLLGEALVRAGRRSEAERELRRAVDIDPGYPAGRTSLATFLQRSGRSAEAESHYREVLRLDPDHLAAVFNIADILWTTGRRDEASRLYRRYLELAPVGDRAGRSIAAARTGEAPHSGPAPLLPR